MITSDASSDNRRGRRLLIASIFTYILFELTTIAWFISVAGVWKLHTQTSRIALALLCGAMLLRGNRWFRYSSSAILILLGVLLIQSVVGDAGTRWSVKAYSITMGAINILLGLVLVCSRSISKYMESQRSDLCHTGKRSLLLAGSMSYLLPGAGMIDFRRYGMASVHFAGGMGLMIALAHTIELNDSMNAIIGIAMSSFFSVLTLICRSKEPLEDVLESPGITESSP